MQIRNEIRDSLWRRPIWLLLGLFAIEGIVFYFRAVTAVAPYYPPGYDQVAYLTTAYDLREAIRAGGIGAVLAPIFRPLMPNTALFPLEGALISLALGMPRIGALTVNFLAFCGLQAACFYLFRRLSGQVAIGLVALSQVLIVRTTFGSAGGMFDFRTDFLAFCAAGLWALAVLRSGVYYDRRWSLVAGLACGWLILNRMLSAVYLGPIHLVLLVWFGIAWWRASDAGARAMARVRFFNLISSGLVIAALSVVPLIANFRAMYDYYYVSLFVNSEREIRAAELNLSGFWSHVSYYPRRLLGAHLGIPWIIFAIALITVAVWLVRSRRASDIARPAMRAHATEFGFLAAVIVVPMVMFNLSLSKSPLIANVLVVPFIALVTIAFATLTRAADEAPSPVGAAPYPRAVPLLNALIVTGLAFAGFVAWAAFVRTGPDLADRLAINRFNDAIIRYAVEEASPALVLSVDRVSDYANAPVVNLRAYETGAARLAFRGLLGHSIFGLTREQALAELQQSDVIVLTEPHGGRMMAYPMNRDIESYWQDLWDWTSANRVPLATETILGLRHTAFVKPGRRTAGLSPQPFSAKH
ncbi:MAG TPA: hypothetical protein VFB16_05565 [Bauldia sp.]|nr:hypothetical protein [Bauldia sp.]